MFAINAGEARSAAQSRWLGEVDRLPGLASSVGLPSRPDLTPRSRDPLPPGKGTALFSSLKKYVHRRLRLRKAKKEATEAKEASESTCSQHLSSS